jgi:hypothetical protein
MEISTLHRRITDSSTTDHCSTDSLVTGDPLRDSQDVDGAAAHPGHYRVEVSGWDAKENFFVEKTYLQWKEPAGKTISLRSPVQTESILFVRLLCSLGGGTSFPVPYRAVRVAPVANEVGAIVSVERLQPRAALREPPAGFLEPAM